MQAVQQVSPTPLTLIRTDDEIDPMAAAMTMPITGGGICPMCQSGKVTCSQEWCGFRSSYHGLMECDRKGCGWHLWDFELSFNRVFGKVFGAEELRAA